MSHARRVRNPLTGRSRSVEWRPVGPSGAKWGAVVETRNGPGILPYRRGSPRARRPWSHRGAGPLPVAPRAGSDLGALVGPLPGCLPLGGVDLVGREDP